jgi:hypothetical protein
MAPRLDHFASDAGTEILRAIHAELTAAGWKFDSERMLAGVTERARYTDGGYKLLVVPTGRGADVRVYNGRRLLNSLDVSDLHPAAGIARAVAGCLPEGA